MMIAVMVLGGHGRWAGSEKVLTTWDDVQAQARRWTSLTLRPRSPSLPPLLSHAHLYPLPYSHSGLHPNDVQEKLSEELVPSLLEVDALATGKKFQHEQRCAESNAADSPQVKPTPLIRAQTLPRWEESAQATKGLDLFEATRRAPNAIKVCRPAANRSAEAVSLAPRSPSDAHSSNPPFRRGPPLPPPRYPPARHRTSVPSSPCGRCYHSGCRRFASCIRWPRSCEVSRTRRAAAGTIAAGARVKPPRRCKLCTGRDRDSGRARARAG